MLDSYDTVWYVVKPSFKKDDIIIYFFIFSFFFLIIILNIILFLSPVPIDTKDNYDD